MAIAAAMHNARGGAAAVWLRGGMRGAEGSRLGGLVAWCATRLSSWRGLARERRRGAEARRSEVT